MIILVSAISSFCFGYGNNAGGGCYAQETFLKKFLSGSNANALIDAMNAIFLAGGFIGTIMQSFVSDKLGRRFCTEMAAILMVLSGILSAASVNPAMFIVSRGIGGISGGIILSNTPVYMSEIAPAHIRGLLVGMHATTVLSGYVLSALLAVAFNFVTSDIQWRLQFIMLTFFSLIFAVSVLFIPESPRWLVEQGRVDEARAIMEKLHRTKADPTAILARAEILQIEAQVDFERDLPHSYWYILSNAHLRRRAYCSIITFAMVQSTGLVVIFNLMPILFGNLGFNNVQQLGLSVVWVTIGAMGAGCNALLADRIGRVKLLVTGGYLLTANMAIQCALQKFYLHSTYKPGINASVAFFFIFILFYSSTCDCVVYIYNAEIWPTHLRSKGVTFGVGSYFLFGIAYSGPAAQAFKSIGWKYYLVFICVTFVTATLILLTFPETKGLSLEEVNIKFGDSVEMTLGDIQLDEILGSKPTAETTEVE
ncbi:general substrate transporter [Mytilinidion resinicola]|uniref:General substrate transporter n=1 Tax=Mytilinidion resinicola TaxID=574789 RepID=A0A6A6YXS4_9PEZI|nr:general substrate transporter [Mytilinidion resinicola]KAF2813722.1 general substrate transporter [Mytilinidion resinicola]